MDGMGFDKMARTKSVKLEMLYHILVLILISILTIIPFRAFSKPCTQSSLVKLIGSPNNRLVYETLNDFAYRVRLAIRFNPSKHELIGTYADQESSVPIKFEGTENISNATSLHEISTKNNLHTLKLKFYDGCERVEGYLLKNNSKDMKIELIVNGEISASNKDVRKKNQIAALNLKKLSRAGSKDELANAFSYPSYVCVKGKNEPIVIASPSDIKKYYSKIFTSAEKKWIELAVPFNLLTGIDNNSSFAKSTINIKNGLITSMCIQTKDSIPVGFICGWCP